MVEDVENNRLLLSGISETHDERGIKLHNRMKCHWVGIPSNGTPPLHSASGPRELRRWWHKPCNTSLFENGNKIERTYDIGDHALAPSEWSIPSLALLYHTIALSRSVQRSHSTHHHPSVQTSDCGVAVVVHTHSSLPRRTRPPTELDIRSIKALDECTTFRGSKGEVHL